MKFPVLWSGLCCYTEGWSGKCSEILATIKLLYNPRVNKVLTHSLTHKEVKYDYQLEDYLRTIRNPAHRISMTKLGLGLHSLRMQTGKYENRGAPIPVEGRTCLVCNRGYIEDERHFLMYCTGYDNIRNELHCLLSTHDVVFRSG